MKRGIYDFDGIDEKLGYYTNCVLKGISLKKMPDHWRLIIKVTDKKLRPQIAFITGDSIHDCMYLLNEAMTKSSITLKWREDLYI